MLAGFVAKARSVMSWPSGLAATWQNDSREMGASILASLLIHLGIAFFLVAILDRADKPKIGSEELDIELVAPRLAPPPANNAAPGARQTEGGQTLDSLVERTPKSAPGARWLASRSKPRPCSQVAEHEEKLAARSARLTPAKVTESEQALQQAANPLPVKQQRRPSTEQQQSDHAPASSGLTESNEEADPVRVGQLSSLPQDIDPSRLLSAVTSEIVARTKRRKRYQARLRERQRRLAQRWARFKRSTETSAVGVADASLAGFAALTGRPDGKTSLGRNGPGDRGAGNKRRGRSPRYGLKFYLSGRPLATSKVVRPPQLLSFSRLGCRIATPEVTPATVRALVTLEGDIDVAYIRHSSSNRRFDTCALKQVRGMRFQPGVDKQGTPLDVWIHVRVAPGLPTTAL